MVFKRPPSEAGDPTIKDLIKRVIGLPGETIEDRDGQVYINGQQLKESYLPAGTGDQHPAADEGRARRQYFVHGRQPDQLEGQPLHRDDPEVAHRRAGLHPGLAPVKIRLL